MTREIGGPANSAATYQKHIPYSFSARMKAAFGLPMMLCAWVKSSICPQQIFVDDVIINQFVGLFTKIICIERIIIGIIGLL